MKNHPKNKFLIHDAVHLFLLFLISNALISYAPLGLSAKGAVILIGILLPIIFSLGRSAPVASAGKTFQQLESFPVPSWRAVLPWVGLALLLRFWGANSPDRWAGGDEILMGMTALDMLDHWKYQFFQTLGEIPTGLAQFSSLLLRMTHWPFFSLYFPPAFVSALSLWVGYKASRQFFSKSLSLVIVGFFAFNFWSLFAARIPYTASFFSLWEFAAFYFLGGFLKSVGPDSRRKWAVLLALWMGSGFLTSALWLMVAAFILLVLLRSYFDQAPPKRSVYWVFGGVFILSLFPLFYAVVTEGYCRHLFSITLHRDAAPPSQWLQTLGAYVSALFWELPASQFPSSSGGFLNLFSASFFFLGIRELFRFKKSTLSQSLAFSFVLFFLGAFLANGIETFRLFEILPILLVIAGIGFQALLLSIPSNRRMIFLIIIFVASPALDASRLFHFFPQAGSAASGLKSDQQRCYEIVSSISNEQGPGMILPEMVPDDADHSLTYFTYPFNAALNPEISSKNAKWLAIYTRQYYVNQLAQRFPEAKWVEFPAGTGKSRNVLGLFPLQPSILPRLTPWGNFYVFYNKMNLKIMELGNGVPRGGILKNLAGYYPEVPSDPFLQSLYFEKLLYNYSWEKNFHPEDRETNWENFSPFLRQSFGKSYQDPNLCEKYGRLLAMEGQIPEAKKAFRQALKIYPGNGWLLAQLRQLDSPK